jgi:protoporphyrinogen/coproporphyrinogen III oxidase
VTGEPRATHAASHLGAMPQYHVGHLERVVRVRALAAGHARLAICGNAFDGIGIPDCIRGANDAVTGLLRRLA